MSGIDRGIKKDMYKEKHFATDITQLIITQVSIDDDASSCYLT